MLKISKYNYLVTISLLALSTSAISREISYDFVQGSYESITDSSLGVDVDGNAYSFSGSFSISPNIAITALFGSASFDRVFGIEVDATEFDFGITAHTSIASGTDISGNFSVINGDIEASDGFTTASTDDTGNMISVGIRHMASDNAEIDVGFSRVDIFDDTSNSFGFGARFYANETFSIGIGYSAGDDIDTIILNARIDIK